MTNTRSFQTKHFYDSFITSARGPFADFNDALRQSVTAVQPFRRGKKECKQNTELNEARMTLIYYYIHGKKRMRGKRLAK